jgi:hypothetical protein
MAVKDLPRRFGWRALAPATLACLAVGCAARETPDAFELFQRFLGARAVELHGPGDLLERSLRRLGAALEQQERIEVRILPGTGGGDPALPRIVFGTLDDPELAELALALGIRRLAPSGFVWLGREHRAPGDAILACAEDPERPGVPLELVLGNDLRSLAELVRDLPAPWECRFETLQDGEPAVEIQATVDGSPVLATLLDRTSERARQERGRHERTLEGIRFRVPAGVSEARLAAYARSCARARDQVAEWLGRVAVRSPEVVLYAHPEDLERALGDAPLGWANPLGRRVHALCAADLVDDGGAACAAAVARELLGAPAEPWMPAALGVAAAGAWWGAPLENWLARLERAGALPAPPEVVSGAAGLATSEHVLVPARAARLARIARSGPEELASVWRGAQALGSDGATAAEPAAPAARRDRPAADAWRGIALEDGPAPGLRSSYGARVLAEALARVRELGANAVSFSVEATLEPPQRRLARLDARAVHGSVPDGALVLAAALARARGLATLWCVQPLGNPAGTRADAFGLIDPQDRADFFRRFERVGTHYACLAQLTGIDVLCLGQELDAAASTRELDAQTRWQRNESWRRSWQALRGLFDGRWTYASSSLTAARAVEFWEELDLVALGAWPTFEAPLDATGSDAVVRVLCAEVEGARELGREVGRPVLWVETGFPATGLGWERPRAPRGLPDAQSQRVFLAGLRGALAPPELAPFAGFLLWNAPVGAGAVGPYSVLERPVVEELSALLGAP